MTKRRIGIPKDFKVKDSDFLSAKSTGWALKMLGVHRAHKRGIKGKDVIVAIGDTGASLDHDSLPNPIAMWQGKFNDVKDKNGHGTHVWGVAYSVAPESHYIIAKVMGDDGRGGYMDIASGIMYSVDNGAHIINLSVGGPHNAYSKRIDDAIQYAWDNNVLIVVASGNSSGKVGYPAKDERVLAIGAIDENGITANFQNKGIELDYVAPGVDIYSTWINNEYRWADGTSQAAPYVSGFCALIIGKYFEKYGSYPTIMETIGLLRKNSIDLKDIGFDVDTGHGIPSATAEGRIYLDNEFVESVNCQKKSNIWASLVGSILSLFKQ